MTTIVAEIGINHNGDLGDAREMIALAAKAGVDYVKFQKRTMPEAVPPEQRDIPKDTPWGRMSYLAYRKHLEFGEHEYRSIDACCAGWGVGWTASVWDAEALYFLRQFPTSYVKIPSAKLTDVLLLADAARSDKQIVLSTGMSTLEEIDQAVEVLGKDRLTLLHCVSAYPCEPAVANLRTMDTLRRRYDVPVGYSGHETGTTVSLAAAALGASMIERHFTLDRHNWGTDQAASMESGELKRLADDVRIIEQALGDGEKTVLECEAEARRRLRG